MRRLIGYSEAIDKSFRESKKAIPLHFDHAKLLGIKLNY
jgi:hypothetical protein